jgi:hypothetical protein
MEGAMEVLDYCRNVENELTAWKAKLYDATSRIEKLPVNSRRQALPRLGELKIIVALLEDKVSMLNARRPLEWAGLREDIEEKMNCLRESYRELMD